VSNLSATLGAALFAAAMVQPRRLGLVSGGALLAALVFAPALDRGMTAWDYPHLIATRDSPYGRVTITAWGDQINVFENGSLAYETGGTAAEEFVAFAALAHPAPRRVLILGGGTAGIVNQVLAHGPAEIVSVETDRVTTATIAGHLPADMREGLSSPRVQLVHDDPRRYLMQSSRGADLILVGMPEPSSGQTNRYYTQEFFAECAARLNARGILAFRLPGAENWWSPPLVARLASIERALGAVFSDVLVLPGSMTMVLAAMEPIPRDPAVMVSRLVERGVPTRLVTPAYLRYVLTNERRGEVAALVAAAQVPTNRDAHPACYRYTLALWLSKFYPAVARFEATDRIGWRAAGVGALVLVLLWFRTRRHPRARLAVVVAAAGGIGMVLESILLLAYQARRGVLYQDLGLLLMLFMAGLALGAATVARLGRGGEGTRSLVLLGGLAALSMALATRLDLGAGPGMLETGIWLVAAGAASAGVFAQASRLASDALRAVGPLYAADVAGGCVGSLAASLLLVPFAGLTVAALVMAALAAVTALWW
jgi:spermidine synthase